MYHHHDHLPLQRFLSNGRRGSPYSAVARAFSARVGPTLSLLPSSGNVSHPQNRRGDMKQREKKPGTRGRPHSFCYTRGQHSCPPFDLCDPFPFVTFTLYTNRDSRVDAVSKCVPENLLKSLNSRCNIDHIVPRV